ncbi:MAG: protein kinase, partial [archaeon]|nr:protein kinase [archaeon]
DGHIKLSDFGLAKVSEKIFDKNPLTKEMENKKSSHQKNYSCVGTANYVAPEVLCKKGYGPEIDWWSVGIIFFEMLCGYAPFCSKDTSEVCSKILNWEKFLNIPKKAKVSKDAEDLIFKMVRGSGNRLGKNGAEEIKRHPFFKSIDWENIRSQKAPFIPNLKNDYDCSYFEVLEEKKDEPFYPVIKGRKRKEVEYIGYTYKGDEDEDEEDDYHEVIETLENIKSKGSESSHGNSSLNLPKEESKGSLDEVKKSFGSETKEQIKEKERSKGSFSGKEKTASGSAGLESQEDKKIPTTKGDSNNIKECKNSSDKKKGTAPLKKIALAGKKANPSPESKERITTATSARNKDIPAPKRNTKGKLSPVPKRPTILQRLALQLSGKKSASPKVSVKIQHKK